MLYRFAAFFALALAGAALTLPEAAEARAIRAGGGFRAPVFMHRTPRAVFGARPRFFRGQTAYASQPIRPFRPVNVPPGTILPSPHGYATTSPLRPFANLQRRHHRIHHSGWSFPSTIGGGDEPGYIGTPYDPAEAIPVYGPAPASGVEPAETAPRANPAAAVRSASESEDPNNACRAEKVTVPSRDGEREITVVRC